MLNTWQKRDSCLLAVILVIVAAAALRVHEVVTVEARSPDEAVYARQAASFVHGGIPAVRQMAEQYRDNPDLWKYPPPTRIGYIYSAAAAMQITGRYDEAPIAYVSCLASILTLILLAVLAWRYTNPYITLIALTWLAVSPMELAIARRAWSDALIETLSAGLILCAVRIIKASERLHWYVCFVLIGSGLLLIKESSIVGVGGCAGLVFVYLCFLRRYSKAVLFIAMLFFGFMIGQGILTYAAGGWQVVKDIYSAVRLQSLTHSTDYALVHQTGPWYWIIYSLWLLSPAVIIFFAAAAGLSAARSTVVRLPAMPAVLLPGLIALVLFSLVPMWVIPGIQNLRYLCAANVPLYLLAAIGGWGVAQWVIQKTPDHVKKFALACAVVIVLCFTWHDFSAYQHIVVRTGIKDLAVRMIIDSAR